MSGLKIAHIAKLVKIGSENSHRTIICQKASVCNISQLSDKNATFMLTTYMQIDEEVVGFYNRQMTRHILVSRIKVIYPKYRLSFVSLLVKPK